LTVREFNTIMRDLNKKENCVFKGTFTTRYEKDGVALVFMDDGYTARIYKDDVVYTKTWDNKIIKTKI